MTIVVLRADADVKDQYIVISYQRSSSHYCHRSTSFSGSGLFSWLWCLDSTWSGGWVFCQSCNHFENVSLFHLCLHHHYGAYYGALRGPQLAAKWIQSEIPRRKFKWKTCNFMQHTLYIIYLCLDMPWLCHFFRVGQDFFREREEVVALLALLSQSF